MAAASRRVTPILVAELSLMIRRHAVALLAIVLIVGVSPLGAQTRPKPELTPTADPARAGRAARSPASAAASTTCRAWA